jgi:putative transposase
MPWQELSPVDLRLRFITEWHTGHWTMTELCGEYAISRKTGYKWLDRYDAAGPRGLADRSRRPHHSPQAIDAEVAELLVAVRRRHPRWGARKLLAVAARQTARAAWPSRSTVCALLKTRGLVTPRGRRARPVRVATSLQPITASNGTWTSDFKGEFRTGDGAYCYPLTLRDGWSRFLLRCDGLAGTTYDTTRGRFARAFAEYGLPDRIRSDNGPPFAGTGLTGLSRLAVWWMRLGIVPERIAVGHPEQNGSHEQFHAVLKAETARPPAATRAAQQRRFDRFRTEYNEERPHEALDDRVPAMLYHPSPRLLPRRLPPLDYAGHLEVRRVYDNGCLWWRRRVLFVSEALAGHDIGFEEVDEGLWTVWFGSVAVARFDERQHRLHPIARSTEGRLAASVADPPSGHHRRQAPSHSSAKNRTP